MKLVVKPPKNDSQAKWPTFRIYDADGRMMFGGYVHLSAVPTLTALMLKPVGDSRT